MEGSGEGALKNVQVLAAAERHKHAQRSADLEIKPEPEALPQDAPFIEQMRWRLQTSAGRKAYDQRKSTIEPVFGIIKEAMGFRRFSMRGLKKVNLEWTLVSLSYNLKRLFHMGAELQNA